MEVQTATAEPKTEKEPKQQEVPAKTIKFKKNKSTGSKDFYTTVRERVNNYFEENGISKHANTEMVSKTIILISAFVISYGLIISNMLSPWLMLVLAAFNGFVTALIGLNVSHDAIHGAYSTNKKTNKLLGLTFNFIGANDYMWKINHNQTHHIVTNIPEHDGDIDQIDLIRIQPQQPRWYIHRFQHIYMFLLYAFASISWVLSKDYNTFFQAHSKKNRNGRKFPYKELFRMLGYKLFYYFTIIAIPFMVIDLPWYQILLGLGVLHIVEGLTLTIIFQLAHVVEQTDFPVPDTKGNILNTWAVHQMYTTANFARKSRLVSYLCGGLNFQVEHHLFPKICHVHYPAIAPIVKQTAEEYNLPYNENESLGSALASHCRLMKDFGKGYK